MIKVYWGVLGQGKTYNANKENIIANLITGDKKIITNVPLVIDKLETYIRKTRPAFIAEEEVYVLSEEQLEEFWRYRWKGNEVLKIDCRDNQEDMLPTCYVIDEGWQVLSARKAGSVNDEIDFFLRHSRRFGFDVIWITHHPSDVPKIVRGLVEQWAFCQNHKFRAAFTVFKRPARFEVQVFRDASPPMGAVPMEMTFPTLNVEIANTYKTQASKGVEGRGTQADKNRKVKGISLMWIPAVILGVTILGWVGCKKTFNYALSKAMPIKQRKNEPKTENSGTNASPKELERKTDEKQTLQAEPVAVVQNKVATSQPEEEELFMTGFMQMPDGEYMLLLSDGDVIKTPSRRVLAIGDRGAIVDGKLIKFDNSQKASPTIRERAERSGKNFYLGMPAQTVPTPQNSQK